MEGVEGYIQCRCGNLVPEHVAWQTKQRCFQCFLDDDGKILRDLEMIYRASVVKLRQPPSSPRRQGKAHRRSSKRGVIDADLARLRACRRMAKLFPEVFDVVYAEERHKAGLDAIPHPEPNHLTRAVQTYARFVAYDPGSTESDQHGASQTT